MRSARFITLLIISTMLVSGCGLTDRHEFAFLCSNKESVCEQWQEDFSKFSGRSVKYVRLPTVQALTRLNTNRFKPEFDAWIGGPAENFIAAKSKGLLSPYYPKHIHDIPKQFRDPEGYWFGIYGTLLGFCSDPEILKRYQLSVPNSWEDLRNKSYRGLISASNPLTSGTGFTVLRTLESIYGSDTKNAIKSIYFNVSRLTSSEASPVRVVQAGEAAIAITTTTYCLPNSTLKHALTISYPAEGTSYEIGGAALLKGSKHATAAKEFLDWLASSQGQKVASSFPHSQLATSRKTRHSLQNQIASPAAPPVLDINPALFAHRRDFWISWFAKQMWD